MRFKHVYFLTLGILSSCAPKAIVEPTASLEVKESAYLFAIGNERVMAEEFLHTLSKNHPGDKVPLLTEGEFDQSLKLIIDFKLKVKEAEERGLDQTDEFKAEIHAIKEDLKEPYLIKNTIQEEELRKTYSRMHEILKASHILTAFPARASQADSIAVLRNSEKLQEKARNGADFNDLAFEYSDDPSAKENKGNLGYFTALQMAYPFEDAAFSLKPGQISDPVLTSYGYHIIKLEDRKPNPGEIRVSHILIETDPADSVSEDRAKSRIGDIYTILQKEEEAWEEVVLSYSEDQGTKGSGGKLPWFGVGDVVQEFEKIAFSLTEVGEISAPVKTRFGYHIIRLEEIRPLSPYKEMETTLTSRILRDSRSSLLQSKVLAMQMKRYDFKERKDLLEKLEPIVNETLSEGIDQLFNRLSEQNLLDNTLMVIQGDSLSVGGFIGFIQAGKEMVKAGPDNYFDPWYNKFKEVSLYKAEEKDLLTNNDEYRMLVQEYRDGILLFSLMNDQVWQKALLDSAGQLAYYKAHLGRYQWSERVPALIIAMAKDDQPSRIRRFLEDKPYSKNLKLSLEDQFLNDNPMLFNVEDNIFVIGEHPILQQLDMSKKYHELIHEGKMHIVVLGNVIPAGPKRFEETRGSVIQDYQKDLDKEFVKKLKEKYIIQINEDEKERISNIVVKR